MPDGIDPSSVRAHCANGILELTVPLPEAVKPRKVPIQIGESETPRIAHTTSVQAA